MTMIYEARYYYQDALIGRAYDMDEHQFLESIRGWEAFGEDYTAEGWYEWVDQD